MPTDKTILNPRTGRTIIVGGPTYAVLVREGEIKCKDRAFRKPKEPKSPKEPRKKKEPKAPSTSGRKSVKKTKVQEEIPIPLPQGVPPPDTDQWHLCNWYRWDKVENFDAIKEYLHKEMVAGGVKPNFESLTSDDLRKLFNLYDKVYFGGNWNRWFIEHSVSLEFDASGKSTKVAGYCQRNSGCKYIIQVSWRIFSGLFTKGEKFHGEIDRKCYNRLGCLIETFIHEMIHLLIFTICDNDVERHGTEFKSLNFNMNNQQSIYHSLSKSDLNEVVFSIPEKRPNKIKDFSVGDIISYTSTSGIIDYYIITDLKKVKMLVTGLGEGGAALGARYRLRTDSRGIIIKLTGKEEEKFRKIAEGLLH